MRLAVQMQDDKQSKNIPIKSNLRESCKMANSLMMWREVSRTGAKLSFRVVFRTVSSSHCTKRISFGPVGLRRTGVPAQEGLHSGREDELQHRGHPNTVPLSAGSSGRLDSQQDGRPGTTLLHGFIKDVCDVARQLNGACNVPSSRFKSWEQGEFRLLTVCDSEDK